MTIYFHIGMPKTGTTALQRFLAANRERLATLGYDYPTFLGSENHTKLAAYALNTDEVVPLKIELKLVEPQAMTRFRSELEQAFRQEISAQGDYIFSNEHCTTYLYQEAELERLKALVTATGQDVRLVLYVREPVSFHASRYSTNLKQGRTTALKKVGPKILLKWYDYAAIAGLWSRVFGRDNLTVRIFARDVLVGGDIRRDFCHVLGLAEGALDFDYASDPNANRSVDYLVASFLLEFNKRVPRYIDNKVNPLRGELGLLCESISRREGILVPDAVAAHMNAVLKEPLARFNKEFLGGGSESPFAPYSPAGKCQMRRLTRKEYMDIFADIWMTKISMEKFNKPLAD